MMSYLRPKNFLKQDARLKNGKLIVEMKQYLSTLPTPGVINWTFNLFSKYILDTFWKMSYDKCK